MAAEAASIARNPLQTKVSRLRRSLGDGSLVTGTRAGYVLNVAPESIDAIEVLRLAGEAAKARASDPAAALAACLHSAMDAEDGDPSAEPRLRAVLQQAHGQHTPDIEIMAMDALARSAANEHDLAAASALLRAADELMPSARHLIGPADRLDADQARTLIEPSHVSKRSGASP